MSERRLRLTKILIEKGLLKGYTKQEGNTVWHTHLQMTGDKSKAAGAAENVLSRNEPLCISSDVLLTRVKTENAITMKCLDSLFVASLI